METEIMKTKMLPLFFKGNFVSQLYVWAREEGI